jgi:subtilisin family serine protease
MAANHRHIIAAICLAGSTAIQAVGNEPPTEAEYLRFKAQASSAEAQDQISEVVVKFKSDAFEDDDAPIANSLLGLLRDATQLDLAFSRVTKTGGQVLRLPNKISLDEAKLLLAKMRLAKNILWAEIVPPQALARPARPHVEPKVDADQVAVETTDRIVIRLRDPETVRLSERNGALPDSTLLALSKTAGITLRHVSAMSGGAFVLGLPSKMPLTAVTIVTEKLEADPSVKYAEPVTVQKAAAVPNDQYYPLQWHFFEPAGGVNLPRAWDISTGSPNLVVAVLDTGILFQHPDLVGRTVPGYNMISDPTKTGSGIGRSADATDFGDSSVIGECGPGSAGKRSSWHGTHVAGTIGAATNNVGGVAGINWNSKILPVRVLGKCGGNTSDIADGIAWAAGLAVPGVPTNPNPAKVINLSLGGYRPCPATYQAVIDQAIANGATIIVAAGNGNPQGSAVNVSTSAPANCNGVISVAANTRLGDKASYSNFGTGITVSAPGGAGEVTSDNVLSTKNAGATVAGANNYDYSPGTSMAAPHVAGIASLLLSVNPSFPPATVKSLIALNTRPFVFTTSCAAFGDCGVGIADAAKTLTAATGPALFYDLPEQLYTAQNQPILYYGSKPIGSTSSYTTKIYNVGLAPLTIGNVTRNGQFNGNTNCIGATLQPATFCTLTVNFLPTTLGNALGEITITNNAFGSPHTMVLAGIGIAANSPGFASTTYNLSFSPQGVGTTSASRQAIITNAGTANLAISSVSVSSDFGGTTTCIGANLVPGATCRIDATFRPTALGQRSGVITISDNATGSPHVINLSGLGIGAPTATFSQTSLSFGTQSVGSTGAAQTVTLSNNGSATLYISGASISGDFVGVSSNCVETLAVGSSCTASFAFAPNVAGARSGNITINSNAPNSPQIITFSGIGAASSAISLISPADGATVAGTSVSLAWSAVAGAGAYSIKLTDVGTGTVYSFPLQTASASNITNLALSTTYRWTVASCTSLGADNATNCPNISAPRTFRTLSPQLQLSRRGGIDIDGNGKSAILLRSASAQLQAGRLVNNQFLFSAQQDPGAGYRLVGVGDFFGSGKSDLAFQNMTQGTFGDIKIWRGFSPSNEVFWRQVKQVWDVQAGGDLDGDGFGDLVWRYVADDPRDTGVSFVWFTNGSSVNQVRKRGGAPLTWKLLGAADLNGDGAADMIYINPSNQARALMATPNRTCANLLIGDIPTNQSALKLGDFTGNGRGDILVRDSSTGFVSLISLDAVGLTLPPFAGAPDDPNASCSSSSVQIKTTPLSLIAADPSWSFFASGDYNGDGILDVVWKRPDGTLTLWLMNAGGATPTVIANAGSSPAGFVPVQP